MRNGIAALIYSCSWRVRIALALKNVEYSYVAIHLVKDGGHQHKESYQQINPSREVPTLSIDGLNLAQSVAIMEYLEESRPEGHALLPADAAGRATVRRLCEMISSNIQPVQNLRVLLKLMSYYDTQDAKTQKKIEWGRYWIGHGFEALEKVLATTAGKYCFGDQVTMADCCLVPQVYNANRFKVDMSKFPTISRINATLAELEAFKAAHPSAQPDAA